MKENACDYLDKEKGQLIKVSDCIFGNPKFGEVTYKEKIFDYLDREKEQLIKMSDYIFMNPEIGKEEYKAVNLLCEYLLNNGFSVEKGLGSLQTAFRATYENGSGGPSIGLLVEYDALDGLGHACAHHMQGPALLGSAIALKSIYKDKPYKIVVYGTPAEETIGGKIVMLNEGFFSDIDVALMIHGNSGTTVDVHSMDMIKYEVTFHGVSAHAAIKPQDGKSALDSLILAFQGIEFLREHTPDDTRIHYTILDAGGAANSVPKTATGTFYLRTYDIAYIPHLKKRFENIMRGAALMSDTDVEINIVKRVMGKLPSYELNNLILENAKILGCDDIVPAREKTGSTDFGCVTHKVPGSVLRIGFVPVGTSSHSQEYLNNGKGEQAERAVVLGSKIIASVCYDLIDNNEIFEKVQKEFMQNKI